MRAVYPTALRYQWSLAKTWQRKLRPRKASLSSRLKGADAPKGYGVHSTCTLLTYRNATVRPLTSSVIELRNSICGDLIWKTDQCQIYSGRSPWTGLAWSERLKNPSRSSSRTNDISVSISADFPFSPGLAANSAMPSATLSNFG